MKKLKWLLLLAGLLFASPSRAQAPAGYTKLNGTLVTAAPFTDTACPNQTTCYYVVTTVDSLGFESLPASCSPTALCVGGNQAVAQMPSSGTHTVTVSWTPVSVASGYNVYVHRGPLPASNVSVTVQ